MPKNDGWGRRLRDAKRDWERAHDQSLSFRELGVRVAAKAGLAKPIPATTAHGWFQGQEPETFAIISAIAAVLEADGGFLVFGQPGAAALPTNEELAAMTGARVADPPRSVEDLLEDNGHKKAAPKEAAKKRRPGNG